MAKTIVGIKMEQEDRKLMHLAAAQVGLSLSAWLRMLGLAAARKSVVLLDSSK